METIQPYLLGWLVPTIAAAVGGYFWGKVKSLSARDKAIENGLRCMLRGEITCAYQRHILDEKPMTLECRRQLDEFWQAYHELGGNGTGQSMYEELCEMPISINK